MEPITSLENELREIEAKGTTAQQSSDPVDVALGVAVIEAVQQARSVLDEAKKEASLAKSFAKDMGEVAPALSSVMKQLEKTDGQLSAVALAYKEGTENQQKAFATELAKHTGLLSQTLIKVSEYQKFAEKNQNEKASAQFNALHGAVKNLILELEDGVKVQIENQAKLPVASFAQGPVKGVSEAVPVMIVDKNGTPTEPQQGAKGGFGGSSFGGQTLNDPLIEYKPSDIDEEGTPAYYGFIAKDGRWYIMTVTATAIRYTKGRSGYTTAWTGRAALEYGYFDVIF